jgi:hypothetical protein
MSGWIGVDLDGTLAMYDGFKGPDHIGAPIAKMVNRVKAWLAQGREVRIFTARVCYGDKQNCRPAIEAWCVQHIGVVLPVTNEKDYGMIELWDDRCVQVMPNTGLQMGVSAFE